MCIKRLKKSSFLTNLLPWERNAIPSLFSIAKMYCSMCKVKGIRCTLPKKGNRNNGVHIINVKLRWTVTNKLKDLLRIKLLIYKKMSSLLFGQIWD